MHEYDVPNGKTTTGCNFRAWLYFIKYECKILGNTSYTADMQQISIHEPYPYTTNHNLTVCYVSIDDAS